MYPTARPNISQFRTTFLNYIKFANLLISKLKNCEMFGQATPSQLWSCKISLTTFLSFMKFVDLPILRLKNSEKAGEIKLRQNPCRLCAESVTGIWNMDSSVKFQGWSSKWQQNLIYVCPVKPFSLVSMAKQPWDAFSSSCNQHSRTPCFPSSGEIM